MRLYLAFVVFIPLLGPVSAQSSDPCACLNITVPTGVLPNGASNNYGLTCDAHDAQACHLWYGPNSQHDLWLVSSDDGHNDWCCATWCYVSSDCSVAETSVLDHALKYSYDACAQLDHVYDVTEDSCLPGDRSTRSHPMSSTDGSDSAEDNEDTDSISDATDSSTQSSEQYLVSETLPAHLPGQDRKLSAPARRGKGGYYGGGGMRTVTSHPWRTSAVMGAAVFVPIVIMSDRRRRYYWGTRQGDTCQMNQEYLPADGAGGSETTTGSPALDQYCVSRMAGVPNCNQCNNCSTAACVSEILGCQEFLSTLYSQCQQTVTEQVPEETSALSAFLSFIFNCLCFCGILWACWSCVTKNEGGGGGVAGVVPPQYAAQYSAQFAGDQAAQYSAQHAGTQMVQQRRVEVTVPPGVPPGGHFQFPHNGQFIQVDVPQMAQAGQILMVNVPEVQPQQGLRNYAQPEGRPLMS